MTVYFLGGGNMATAIVAGLHGQNQTANVHVVDRSVERCELLEKVYGVRTSTMLPDLKVDDVLVLAVKPQDMAVACADVVVNGALVLSLAAGLTIDILSRYLGGSKRIVRVMPNTPASVGLAISGLFADKEVSEQDRQMAENLMSACGQIVWLEQEEQMNAITAVSGSGSAYVFYLMNALFQAALSQGFNSEQAYRLSLQTFKGAVTLAEQSGECFTDLQDRVTSKGGTTFAALEMFRKHHIAEHLQDGVQAAAERSAEMARVFAES